MARVLGRVRQSRTQDDSISENVQRDAIQRWADSEGHEVVGWAVDLNTSGTKDPFQTESLGPWLNKRADEFDILACYKMDRLSRVTVNAFKLLQWSKENGKAIKAVEDKFDPSSREGELIFFIVAWLAEGELSAIQQRAKDTFTRMVADGRYRGGHQPYGYRTVKAEKGWRFEVDPETAETIRRITSEVTSGVSNSEVCRRLNAEGVPTPRDADRVRAGKAPKGYKWTAATLGPLLRSKGLMGVTTVNADGERVEVRGSDGVPVQFADPILSRAEFGQLQTALDSRTFTRARNRVDASPMLHVAYCACGSPMFYLEVKRYSGEGENRYYRCGARSADDGCPLGYGNARRADEIEELVTQSFLDAIGHLPMLRRVFVPGEDNAQELEKVREALEWHVTALQPGGVLSHPSTRDKASEALRELQGRYDELSGKPSIPDRWVSEETGETYREFWERSGWADRRQLLLEFGFKAVLFEQSHVRMMQPADFVARAKATEWTAEELAARSETEAAIMREWLTWREGGPVRLMSDEAIARIVGKTA
ncbi:recombinase family protein [Actinopolymorpha pittospori]